MIEIAIKVACYWRLKNNNNYVFSKEGRCFNLKTGNEIQQSTNSRCIGYYIKGKFKSLTAIKKTMEVIPKKEFCPF